VWKSSDILKRGIDRATMMSSHTIKENRKDNVRLIAKNLYSING